MNTKFGPLYLFAEAKKAAADFENSLRTERFKRLCDNDALPVTEYWNGHIKKGEAIAALAPTGTDEERDVEFLLTRAFDR